MWQDWQNLRVFKVIKAPWRWSRLILFTILTLAVWGSNARCQSSSYEGMFNDDRPNEALISELPPLPTRCGDWTQFALPPDKSGEKKAIELFHYFVQEYQQAKPDDGCLMAAALGITERVFINPRDPFYELFFNHVEAAYQGAAATLDGKSAMGAIMELATIFQARWAFLYIDSYSRHPNNQDLYYISAGGGAVGLVMALGFVSRYKILGRLGLGVLKKFSGLYKNLATLPNLMGLTGGAAGVASARKNRKTKGPNPLSVMEVPEEFVKAPFEILTVTEGLKANYSRAELMRSLQGISGAALASLLVGATPRTMVWLYRAQQAYTASLLEHAAARGSLVRITAVLAESRAAAFLAKPGWITLALAFAASFSANKVVAQWAQDRYVDQFRKAFDETRAQLRALKGAGRDWDRFYLGEKLVIAEREWSAMEAAPVVHDLNHEIAKVHFTNACVRLSTRPKGSSESPVWPRKELGLDAKEYEWMFEFSIQKFRESLVTLKKHHEPILLLSRKGFKATVKALDDNNVPHSAMLKKELEPGIQTTENLLIMDQFGDPLVQQLREDLEPLAEGSPAWNDYALLRDIATQYNCYIPPAPQSRSSSSTD